MWSKNTPPNTNIAPSKMMGLEDYVTFKMVPFSGKMFIFGGVIDAKFFLSS